MAELALVEARHDQFQEPENRMPYRALIEEAYLKPIRSVVIVDDDFPTLENYLAGQPNKRPEDIERLKKLLARCRSKDTNWLVDVHDGADQDLGSERDNLGHLHQSDLLILDYHLNGNQETDKAISILRRLASNDHFNLVVVYTNGYGQGPGSELARVGYEIARALTFIPNELVDLVATVPEELMAWEDEEENIQSRLLDSIDIGAVLKAINSEEKYWKYWKSLDEMSSLSGLIDERQRQKKQSMGKLGDWVVAKRVMQEQQKFAQQDYGQVTFSCRDRIWIRTDKLFVTVVGKSTEPAELPKCLLDSLENWNPSPHRLLMAKIRADLDASGVGAESIVLNQKFVQAGWMEKMLKASEIERPWRVRESTMRHWEEMAAAMQASVQDFAKNLFASIPPGGKDVGTINSFIKGYTGVDLAVDQQVLNVKLHLNCNVCSKEIEGHHLMPGHVLKIEANGNNEYWLCLSPACDLVPGQSQRWGGNKLEHVMPFKAVLLEPKDSIQDALKAANSNEFVFLRIDGVIKAFRFVEGSNSNPRWEQMFAHSNGHISKGESHIHLTRIHANEQGIMTKVTTATLVAQLRYEYALNLLQRLGSALSRVGLDFVEHK